MTPGVNRSQLGVAAHTKGMARAAFTLLWAAAVIGCAPAETPDAPLPDEAYAEVDRVIGEMNARYERVREGCDHRGLFGLVYLRTTEEYRRASHQPGFFEDPRFVNDEDVRFAQYYFDAFDAWERGDLAHVPAAWRDAFEASIEREETALGDVMLGVSAHINRDLPYVLAELGLVNPETKRSREADHDKVNVFLARVNVASEVRQDWDPAWSAELSSGSSLVREWRDSAWTWAEKLVTAETPERRAEVEQSLEREAEEIGQSLRRFNAYREGEDSSERDEHCRGKTH